MRTVTKKLGQQNIKELLYQHHNFLGESHNKKKNPSKYLQPANKH